MSALRRAAVLAVVGLALAACADEAGDGGGGASTDTVSATVLPSPTESGDADLVADSGVTTTAAADEVADRESLPPTNDVVTRSPDAVGDGSPPQNVGTAIVRITDADGDVCEVCMWLADEPDERSTGLMGVQDLGQPIGMAFAWDAPADGSFYMFHTVTPLSIAWFAPDGSYLSESDMDPCTEDVSSACELYGTTGPYTLAIEMFEGQLGKVGIGPGSTAEIVQVADPATEVICPLLS